MTLPQKTFTHHLVNWFTFLAVLIICLVIAEIALRQISTEELYHKKVNFKLSDEWCDGHCYSSNEQGQFPLNANELLANGAIQDPQLKKIFEVFQQLSPYCVVYNCPRRRNGFYPERKGNIAIFGDSFTFGEGVPDEDSLGALLGEKYPYNVINYGKSGANIVEMQQVVLKLLSDHPDLKGAIYFYNINDVLVADSIGRRWAEINDFQNIRWINRKRDSALLNILRKSRLFAMVEKSILLAIESKRTTDNYLAMYLSEENQDEWDETQDILSKIAYVFARRHIPFHIVIYPLIYKDIFGNYPFAPIHDEISQACQEKGLSCFDGQHIFDGYRSMKQFAVHPVDYHPNEQANRLMADFVAEHIKF